MDSLTATQKKTVISYVLNKDKLADAVLAGDIPAKLVEQHSEIKESQPYITISRGTR